MGNGESTSPLTQLDTSAPPIEVELHPHISGGEEGDAQPPIKAEPPNPPVDFDLGIVSASIPLKKITDWDGTSQDIDQALIAAFEASDYLKILSDLWLRNINSDLYINNLDKVNLYPVQRRHA